MKNEAMGNAVELIIACSLLAILAVALLAIIIMSVIVYLITRAWFLIPLLAYLVYITW